MRPVHIILPAFLTAIAACASPQSQTGASLEPRGVRQCFNNADITGFSDAGPDVALVNIASRDTWELTLSPGCPDVDHAMSLGIVSRGRTMICTGRDAELLIPNLSGRGSQRCLVRNIRKLSPEEAAAARGDKPRG